MLSDYHICVSCGSHEDVPHSVFSSFFINIIYRSKTGKVGVGRSLCINLFAIFCAIASGGYVQ